MCRCLLILSALAGLTLANANDPFLQFAKNFGKQYPNTREWNTRREIFLTNYQDMVEHNARYETGEVSWTRKVTEFYDLTYDEFVVARGLGITAVVSYNILYNQSIIGVPYYDSTTKFEDIEDPAFMEKLEEVRGTAPAEWSWVAQGAVSSVKNQVHRCPILTKYIPFS